MTPETVFIFFTSLLLLWIKPGPGQALKITTALNDGTLAAFNISLGIISGCILFFTAASLGSKIITNFFNDIAIILKLIGAAYLFYIGFKTLKNPEKGQWTKRIKDKTNIHKTLIKNYTTGLFLTLANPLPIFFFLGILPTLVPVGNLTFNDILGGIFIICLVGLIADGLLILLVSQAKQALSNTQFVKKLNWFTGSGFILIGLFLLYSAFINTNYSFDIF